MSLRTKIVVWFLLLSVVPLAAIVSYSYVSSNQALRQAVLIETWELAEGLSDRMASTRAELAARVQELHELPWQALLADGALGGDYQERLAKLAPYVDTLEFIPAPPAPKAIPAPPVGDVPDIEPLLIELETLLSVSPEQLADAWQTDEVLTERHQLDMTGLGADIAAATLASVKDSLKSPDLDPAERERLKEFSRELSRVKKLAFKKLSALEKHELQRREQRQLQAKTVLGSQYDCPVEVAGEEIGRLRAGVLATRVVSEVLAEADRTQGEVPFAFDADGRVYYAEATDEASLRRAGLIDDGRFVKEAKSPDWVVAFLDDEESDLTFGIARPIQKSVRKLRATAGRNFGVGLGLVGLALIGVVPMSRRITRDLEELTAGSERIAAGNWDVRVPVRSRDEVGKLALSFNRMAKELAEHQEQLVQTQLQQQLLEVENDRKGRELEEARQFQLSLLPRRLPDHPDVEIAVFMRTATEVGGDYYDFKVSDNGALTTVIGDATGHGAKAGTMVTVIKSLFTAWWGGEELARFLSAAAEAIRSMRLGRMAMALMLARIEGRTLKISSAGMPPLLICHPEGDVEELALSGLPLGGMARCSYEEATHELRPGDTVLLMSDGFPELPNEEGEPVGYEKVRELFEGACGREPSEIIDRLATFADDWHPATAPADDITFVVLRMRDGS